MTVSIVAGGQWGDEGKGKIVAYLSLKDRPGAVARAGVGPNAGHTVHHEGRRYGLRQVPCGFVNKNCRLLLGPGMLVDPGVLLREVEETGCRERLGVDRKCSIIEPRHIEEDLESGGRIGTTGTGCGPANVARIKREAKLAGEVPELQPFLTDVPLELHEFIEKGEDILVEGSQGFGLSLFHGTYPFVTSKDTTASTLAADVGLGPTEVDEVILVFKSYPTRVGLGPFPTEIPEEEAEKMGIVEYGTVTGRRRRVGRFDFEMARRAAMINGATQLVLTCLDRLFKFGPVQRFEDLPPQAKKFVEEVEEKVGVPVTLISTGPEIEHIIDLRAEKL
ncbi:MAG: adenylosuccinate synthetase [Candidatus Hadarchaeales archaeon]